MESTQPLRQLLKNTVSEALLNAAEETLIEKGYENTTMQDIANRAGCAVGTIYVYFRSKEEFFRAIVQRRFSEVQGALETAMASVSDPMEQLRAFVEIHVRWARGNLKFVNLISSVMPVRYYDFEARMNELMPECKDGRGRIIATVRQAQQLGQIRRDIEAETIAEMMWGIMVTILDQFSSRPEKHTLEEQLQICWGFIATGMTGGQS